MSRSVQFLLPWYLQADLEDILQETIFVVFCTAIRLCESDKIDLGRPSADINAYLRKIARNALRDQVTKSRKLADRRPLPLLGEIVATRDPIEEASLVQDLRQLLRDLSDKDRQIIEWRAFEGLSYAQIAVRADTTANAAKTRYYRALQRLREGLGI